MKQLYDIVESILDDDFVDVATERVKEIKRYGHPAIYNMSLSTQYVATELTKIHKFEWRKTDKRIKLGRVSIDEYVCDIPESLYASKEINLDKWYDILNTATHLPEHIQLPEDEYWMMGEDYVDEETGDVIPCIRIDYKDGAKKFRTYLVFGFNPVDENNIQLAVYGKFLKI